jgi:hypothetical protein
MATRYPSNMRSRIRARALATAMLTTLLLASCAACPSTPVESAPAAEPAAAAIEPRVWREVFSGLARRADRGDADSARLALEMHRSAPHLYGEGFDATAAQLQHWHCRVQGRDAPCSQAAPAA